jgi:hypothetical protein
MQRFLTPWKRGGKDGSARRAVAGVWIVTIALIASPPVGAGEPSELPGGGGGPDPAQRLVRRALRRAGLDGESDFDERARWSALWPSLRLGAGVLRPDVVMGSGQASRWEVAASLRWPLDRPPVDEAGSHRTRAARRAALAERVAVLWRSRLRLGPPTGDLRADALLRLRAEEIDGELEALTGEPACDEARRDEVCP